VLTAGQLAMKPAGFVAYRFAVLALLCQGVLPGCIESSASERPLEVQSQEIVELLKGQQFDAVSERFVLPDSYSSSRQLQERKKIAIFIQTLFSQSGQIIAFSQSDFSGSLYPLTVTSGDSPNWVKKELNTRTTIIRYAVSFELLGDVYLDLSFAETKKDDWELYALGLGDTEESSAKTKSLNQIGLEIVQELASGSK